MEWRQGGMEWGLTDELLGVFVSERLSIFLIFQESLFLCRPSLRRDSALCDIMSC